MYPEGCKSWILQREKREISSYCTKRCTLVIQGRTKKKTLALMEELVHLDKSKVRGNRNKGSFCKWENGLEHSENSDGTSESAVQ